MGVVVEAVTSYPATPCSAVPGELISNRAVEEGIPETYKDEWEAARLCGVLTGLFGPDPQHQHCTLNGSVSFVTVCAFALEALQSTEARASHISRDHQSSC